MPMLSGMGHLLSSLGIDTEKVEEAIENAKAQLAEISLRFKEMNERLAEIEKNQALILTALNVREVEGGKELLSNGQRDSYPSARA